MALDPEKRARFRARIVENLRDDEPDESVVEDLLFDAGQAWKTGVMDGLINAHNLTDVERIASYERVTRDDEKDEEESGGDGC